MYVRSLFYVKDIWMVFHIVHAMIRTVGIKNIKIFDFYDWFLLYLRTIPAIVGGLTEKDTDMGRISGRKVGGYKYRNVKKWDLKGNLIAEYEDSVQCAEVEGISYSRMVYLLGGENRVMRGGFVFTYGD